MSPAGFFQDGVGGVNGLAIAQSVVVSPDGRRVFVTGDVGSVLAIYRRDPASGVVRLLQAETDQARSANLLAGVRATAASRDGRSLYAAAPIDDAVVAFVPEPGAAALGIAALLAIRICAARGGERRRRRRPGRMDPAVRADAPQGPSRSAMRRSRRCSG